MRKDIYENIVVPSHWATGRIESIITDNIISFKIPEPNWEINSPETCVVDEYWFLVSLKRSLESYKKEITKEVDNYLDEINKVLKKDNTPCHFCPEEKEDNCEEACKDYKTYRRMKEREEKG